MNVAVVTTNNSLKIMGDGSVAASSNSDLL